MALAFSLVQLQGLLRSVPGLSPPFPFRVDTSTDRCFPQPLMSLLFGNLVQDFVNFNTAILNINPSDPDSSVKVEKAASAFRHATAEDASYLTYIGA
jgi:hypothetical protein